MEPALFRDNYRTHRIDGYDGELLVQKSLSDLVDERIVAIQDFYTPKGITVVVTEETRKMLVQESKSLGVRHAVEKFLEDPIAQDSLTNRLTD